MKKIFLGIFVMILSFFGINNSTVNANWEEWWISHITVKITEKAPFMEDCSWPDEKWIFTCNIKPWIWSLIVYWGYFIKWFTFITLLMWVLFLIVYGILYSMSWVDQTSKEEVKKRIKQWAFWVILLLLSGVILNTLFPWIYQL